MGGSLRIARVRGIDIRVHVTFLLVVIWGAMAFGKDHGMAGVVFGTVFMLVLFTCVVLHELGHSLVALRFGVPVKDITLYPIGGVARLMRNPSDPMHELLIAIAGPAVNFVIAALLLLATGFTGNLMPALQALLRGETPMTGGTLLFFIMSANLSLGLFNLLPAFPMDGGRVLRALLSMAFGPLTGTRIAAVVGQVLAVAMIAGGLLMSNLMLAIIGVFVLLTAGNEVREQQARAVLTTLRVGDAYNRHAMALTPADTVSRVADYILTSYQPDFAVLHGGRLLGVVRREDILRALHEEEQDVYVAQIMHRDVLAVPPEMTLDQARQVMLENQKPIAAVYQGEAFLGLVSLDDMAEALGIAAALKRRAPEA